MGKSIGARDLDLLTRGDLARTASQLPRVGAQHPTAIRGTFDDDRQYRFSAMMHGYMAFDQQGTLLVPFRTWRNAITEEAEKALTALFQYNIPQRWSIAHLYQAILNQEAHVPEVAFSLP